MRGRRGWNRMMLVCCVLGSVVARAQVSVPEAPPPSVKPQEFHDGHFGVRFRVPQGWSLTRRDKEVSTFHLDARTASPRAVMRSVATIEFNPYPYSTFSGALVYFSVEPHSAEMDCVQQATGVITREGDVQRIGGMSFVHGHDEHGKVCVEARDEVYTAYHKGKCYRFDLAMNTFCSVSSGVEDMTLSQLQQMDQRMANILSTVQLDWEKTGPTPVPAPRVPLTPSGAMPEVHTTSVQGMAGRPEGGQ